MSSLVPALRPSVHRPRPAPSVARAKAATHEHRSLVEVAADLDRARPVCTVYALSNSDHLVQIYAGLFALSRAGHIRLRQRFAVKCLRQRLSGVPVDEEVFSDAANGVFVDIEGAGLVYFETRDCGNYYPEIADHVLLYAKRSFRSGDYGTKSEKFVPLGLNYSVYLDRAGYAELAQSLRKFGLSRLALKRLAISLARVLPPVGRLLDVPTVRSLFSRADPRAEPKAIFLARTWEAPAGHPDEVPFRELNDFRAACIRALRESLGPTFLGGFSRSAHACREYADCVVDPAVNTRRRDYLKRLRSYPVCVATTGLYQSIGWKFAEYVALSKAIVSEPLEFQVPGPMASGENYLEFTTPETCVARVAELLEHDGLRRQMMDRNTQYYLEYGSPGALVGRVLHAALYPDRREAAP
jgi:hypothetical protein